MAQGVARPPVYDGQDATDLCDRMWVVSRGDSGAGGAARQSVLSRPVRLV